MADFEFPSEVIDLPSQGWFYDVANPLSSGQVDLYYMTAKHEDILTSKNLWSKGVALDRLLESLIASKDVKYDNLLLGDKDAIFLAARIMAYGKSYNCTVTCPGCGAEQDETVNLEELSEVPVTFDPAQKGKNEFAFELPFSHHKLMFKLLTHADEKAIRLFQGQLKKAFNDGIDHEITTRMKQSILSVNGDTNPATISKCVDAMPTRDAKAFREYAKGLMPAVDFRFDFTCTECDHIGRVDIPIDATFLWPES